MKSLSSLLFSPVLLVAYVVMLMSAEMTQLNTLRWWDPLVASVFNILFYSALAWTICLFAAAVGRRLGHVAHIVVHIVLVTYSVSTLFLYFAFGRHWDAYTMQFLRETNWREASEFCSTYMTDWHFVALLVVAVVALAFEVVACRRIQRRRLVPLARWAKAALVGWQVAMWSNVAFFGLDADRNYDVTALWHSPIKRNALWNMWQSCLVYGEFRAEFDKCAQVQRSYSELSTCAEKNSDVVFIIGESFSRHMSNMYDGRYNTNPLLLRRKRNADADSLGSEHGKMYVFTDVIATDNGTTQNFKYFMSTASVAERGERWFAKPLFPMVLRRCGYNVAFYSNQFAPQRQPGAVGRFDGVCQPSGHRAISLRPPQLPQVCLRP